MKKQLQELLEFTKGHEKDIPKPLLNKIKELLEEPETETGLSLIAAERAEQLTKHNRSILADVQQNSFGQLVDAAGTLLMNSGAEGIKVQMLRGCPTHWEVPLWQKMVNKPYKERLIIAAALIAAELDVILYTEDTKQKPRFGVTPSEIAPGFMLICEEDIKEIKSISLGRKVQGKDVLFTKGDEYKIIAVTEDYIALMDNNGKEQHLNKNSQGGWLSKFSKP